MQMLTPSPPGRIDTLLGLHGLGAAMTALLFWVMPTTWILGVGSVWLAITLCWLAGVQYFLPRDADPERGELWWRLTLHGGGATILAMIRYFPGYTVGEIFANAAAYAIITYLVVCATSLGLDRWLEGVRRFPTANQCRKCGYRLVALAEPRCPECGTTAHCARCGQSLVGSLEGVCARCGHDFSRPPKDFDEDDE